MFSFLIGLILLPFRLVFGILHVIFSIIGGIFSLAWGLISGVVGLALVAVLVNAFMKRFCHRSIW